MDIQAFYRLVLPRFRRRRLAWFAREVDLTESDRMLDIGGYPWSWDLADFGNPITLLNLSYPDAVDTHEGRFECVTGDACEAPFADGAFDVVFSNSVIEHLGSWERQQAFAAQARRLGPRLWVQTPARASPVEPHLIAPFIHWLPVAWQRRLIRHGTGWGWMTRPSRQEVDAFLSEVRLLRRSEMQTLFPDCRILVERVLWIPKSYIAVRNRHDARGPICPVDRLN